jgi:hypothetical protein
MSAHKAESQPESLVSAITGVLSLQHPSLTHYSRASPLRLRLFLNLATVQHPACHLCRHIRMFTGGHHPDFVHLLVPHASKQRAFYAPLSNCRSQIYCPPRFDRLASLRLRPCAPGYWRPRMSPQNQSRLFRYVDCISCLVSCGIHH